MTCIHPCNDFALSVACSAAWGHFSESFVQFVIFNSDILSQRVFVAEALQVIDGVMLFFSFDKVMKVTGYRIDWPCAGNVPLCHFSSRVFVRCLTIFFERQNKAKQWRKQRCIFKCRGTWSTPNVSILYSCPRLSANGYILTFPYTDVECSGAKN